MSLHVSAHVLPQSADARRFLLTARPRYALLVDDYGLAPELAAAGITVIGRHQVSAEYDPNRVDDDYRRSPQAYYDHVLAEHVERNPAVSAWKGPNEPHPKSRAAYERYAEFSIGLGEILKAHGKGVVVGNFPTGVPDLELEDILNAWRWFMPAVQWARENNGYVGLHEYIGNIPAAAWLNPDAPAHERRSDPAWRGFLAGRYRYLWDACAAAGVPRPRVLIMECGIGDVGPVAPFRRSLGGDGRRYVREYIVYYDRLIRADDVHGFTFTFGGRDQWFDFWVDESGYTDEMLAYNEQIADQPEVVPDPPPVVVPPAPAPSLLGVDVSHHQQANLPWPSWVDRGVRFAIVRASIGYIRDSAWPRHVEQAKAAGVRHLGAYHYLLHHDSEIAFFDPVRQARVFLDALTPDVSLCMLDIESGGDIESSGLTESFVRAWCDTYDAAETRRPLLLYGNMELNIILGRDNPRYAKYGLWVSDYGFYLPGTTKLPLRSEPPDDPRLPRIPRLGTGLRIWQFAGDNGRLLPYGGSIDLNVFRGTAADLAALFGEQAPPPEGEDELNETQKQRIEAELAVMERAIVFVRDVLDEPPPEPPPPEPLPWWETMMPPYQVRAVVNPLALYVSPGGAVDRRVNAVWTIDIMERREAWLRVTGNAAVGSTGLWVKAQDVQPLPGG